MSSDMQPSGSAGLDYARAKSRERSARGELGPNRLGAQAFFRLNLLQERVDFLLAFQRVETAIDVVAQYLSFSSSYGFLAGDFGPHTFKGTVLPGRGDLGIGRAAYRPRTAMLCDQQVGLATSLGQASTSNFLAPI